MTETSRRVDPVLAARQTRREVTARIIQPIPGRQLRSILTELTQNTPLAHIVQETGLPRTTINYIDTLVRQTMEVVRRFDNGDSLKQIKETTQVDPRLIQHVESLRRAALKEDRTHILLGTKEGRAVIIKATATAVKELYPPKVTRRSRAEILATQAARLARLREYMKENPGLKQPELMAALEYTSQATFHQDRSALRREQADGTIAQRPQSRKRDQRPPTIVERAVIRAYREGDSETTDSDLLILTLREARKKKRNTPTDDQGLAKDETASHPLTEAVSKPRRKHAAKTASTRGQRRSDQPVQKGSDDSNHISHEEALRRIRVLNSAVERLYADPSRLSPQVIAARLTEELGEQINTPTVRAIIKRLRLRDS